MLSDRAPVHARVLFHRQIRGPGNSLRQKLSSHAGESCCSMALTILGVAMALARGNRSRSGTSPKKFAKR
jgi:hypothetical protein